MKCLQRSADAENNQHIRLHVFTFKYGLTTSKITLLYFTKNTKGASWVLIEENGTIKNNVGSMHLLLSVSEC